MLVMLIAALWLLQRELKQHTLQEFIDSIKQIPVIYLVIAIFLTILNYAILVCYDWLGIWYIRHPMKFGRVALASFLGYAVGNNFGLLFGGSTIRYRLYSTWGLSTSDIVRLLFILAITFWIGLFALSGIVFLINPLPIPENWNLPIKNTRPIGWVLTIAASSYLLLCLLRRKPLKFKNVDCSPPPIGLALMQYFVAGIDLIVAAGVLYALLSSVVEVSFFHFVTIFLMAQVAVFITQVPGGIGVLELSMITLLGEDEAAVFGALLAYRMIFYLTPMLIGLILLVAHEITANRTKLKPAFEALSRWTPDIAPRLLAFNAFAAGIVLVFAAALPTTTDRIVRINHYFPIWLVDYFHAIAAMIGVALMVTARGITHRVVSTFWVTLALYGLGLIFTFAGSFGIEVAVFLLIMITAHAPCRHYFFRDSVVNPDRVSLTWLTGILVVIGVGYWLMWFAYKEQHLSVGVQSMFESAVDNHAGRSLRSLIGALVAICGFYSVRSVITYFIRARLVSKKDLEIAREIALNSSNTMSQLATLGDKRILMNAEKNAMISYGIRGSSWVAVGDPIGPRDDALQIAWDFFELCKSGDNWPVFYAVDSSWLDVYSEMGLVIEKIGQEARVDLASFAVDSIRRKEFADLLDKFDSDRFSIRVISPPDVAEQIPVLNRISNLWLKDKNIREMQFSIPFFHEDNIANSPVLIVERHGETAGFATLWKSSEDNELSVGLLRTLPDTPPGLTEYLFVHSMLWGRDQGYQWFSLGMAPLADDQAQQESPIRSQLTALTFRHSQHVYTRHGLRNYKERFDPVWRPKYLASPGGYATKIILDRIAELNVSGSIWTGKKPG